MPPKIPNSAKKKKRRGGGNSAPSSPSRRSPSRRVAANHAVAPVMGIPPQTQKADDLSQIIANQVPLTQTRSASESGDSEHGGDVELRLDPDRPKDRDQHVARRKKLWIWGSAGVVVVVGVLAAGACALVFLQKDLRNRRSKNANSANLDLVGPDFNTDGWTFVEDDATDSPTLAPTTSAPSGTPSAYPTVLPSLFPTAPTYTPSGGPSLSPTKAPTTGPSSSPTSEPTTSPTDSPTPVYFPVNREPDDPPPGYFNYDPDSDYGPHRWNRVNTRDHWLREFGSDGFGPWDGHFWQDLTDNQCGGRKRKQSPKDLSQTRNTECEAGHEIRTACATDALTDDDAFEKQILPHKLSIKSRRRPCLNVDEDGTGRGWCDGHRPPMVDYPRYASDGSAYSDMHHMDFKIPGEHTLEGVRFDAEIQMFHTHLSAPRGNSIAVPIRAEDGVWNEEFQWILNAFQKVYDEHKEECEASKRQRNLRPLARAFSTAFSALNATKAEPQRELQLHRRKFNPYSDALMPGMFFYRYDGSITEPPCREITWWVMDEPAVIGSEQLLQLRTLLFSHVDENCRPTSVHNADQEVVRPIQPLGEDREIQHCPAGSFRSDTDKGRLPAKRCRA